MTLVALTNTGFIPKAYECNLARAEDLVVMWGDFQTKPDGHLWWIDRDAVKAAKCRNTSGDFVDIYGAPVPNDTVLIVRGDRLPFLLKIECYNDTYFYHVSSGSFTAADWTFVMQQLLDCSNPSCAPGDLPLLSYIKDGVFVLNVCSMQQDETPKYRLSKERLKFEDLGMKRVDLQ